MSSRPQSVPRRFTITWTASTDTGTGVAGYRVFRNGTLVGSPTATTFADTGLTASTLYSYTVSAVDSATPANQSAASTPATATTLAPPDTIPPSVPGGVVATPISTSQITVTWTASTDAGTGVAGYRVFRNGTLVGSPTATTFADTGLTASTQYSYTVSAVDNATPANQSVASSPATATTFAVPTGLAIRVNTAGPAYTDSLGQAWAADSGFNTGNASTVGNAIANTVDDVLYQSERWDDAAAPEMQYSFAVPNGSYLVRLHFAENFSGAFAVGARVFDVDIEGVRRFEDIDVFAAAGARAALVRSATVDVADGQINILFRHQTENPLVYAIEIIGQGGAVDTTPPSVPGGVVATPVSASQITVTWTVSTDAGTGVAGYRVFRNGTLVGSPTATTFTDTGLTASTLYSYTVSAVDNAVPSNQSAASAVANATTLAPPPDTTPPSVPTGVQATPLSTSQIAVSWTASTDAGTGVAGYRVFRNGTLIGSPTATTYTDVGLTASTQYSYTVRAVDNATPANQSTPSTPASATTLGATAGPALRINTAGPAYTDSLGQVWAADSGFNTGVVNAVGDAIANTVDDVLYQTNRWDDAAAPEMQYSFAVPNGSYLVRLHFAENFSGAFAVGARVFDVDIEGVRRFEDIDVFAAAGARTALVRSTDRRRRRRSDQHPVPPPDRESDDRCHRDHRPGCHCRHHPAERAERRRGDPDQCLAGCGQLDGIHRCGNRRRRLSRLPQRHPGRQPHGYHLHRHWPDRQHAVRLLGRRGRQRRPAEPVGGFSDCERDDAGGDPQQRVPHRRRRSGLHRQPRPAVGRGFRLQHRRHQHRWNRDRQHGRRRALSERQVG